MPVSIDLECRPSTRDMRKWQVCPISRNFLPTSGLRSVAALVGRRAAAFELGIVCQVFGLDRSDDGLPTYDFAVCAARPGLVPTTSGFAVEATAGLDHLAASDLVVIPAWPDLDAALSPDVADALRAAEAGGAALVSVCSGAFALAGAGLLDGRRATTHWQFADRLAHRFPGVRVEPDVLYVVDGSVLTSAGAAAGIDACLHVVRLAHGAATANALARRMVVAAHRAGGQAQYVEMPVASAPTADGLAEVLDWAVEHLDRQLTVAEMAARARMSARSFARHFRAATGTTPHRWLLDQRLQRAEELLESTDVPVDVVAGRCGFGSPDTLRHHFRASPRHHALGPSSLVRGVTPTPAARPPSAHAVGDRQVLHAAHEVAVRPLGVAGQLDGGELAAQAVEHGAQLAPGELGAEAEVGAAAEADLAIGVGPADVERHRVGEHVLVAVGRRVAEQHPAALGDVDARPPWPARWRSAGSGAPATSTG